MLWCFSIHTFLPKFEAASPKVLTNKLDAYFDDNANFDFGGINSL